MRLSEKIQNVLALQHQYDSTLTEAMRRRGVLVRAEIPSELSTMRNQLIARIGLDHEDLLIEGSDGIGRKASVPWVRFSSRERSPSASQGWYVVFLFAESGHSAYLALAHASTIYDHGNFVDRSPEEAKQLVSWAQEKLQGAEDARLISEIRLGDRRLSRGYEATSVVAYAYPQDNVPDDVQLSQDVLSMASRLRRLYEAERLGQLPLSGNPEVAAAEAAVKAITSPLAGKQSFGLTAEERRAVELHAMELASTHLRSLGFKVEDVSATESYDLVATRADEEFHIEVKGSTGACDDILLTRNEVRHHLTRFPKNGLVITSNVALSGVAGAIFASGGDVTAIVPWELDSDRLTALSYEYKVR